MSEAPRRGDKVRISFEMVWGRDGYEFRRDVHDAGHGIVYGGKPTYSVETYAEPVFEVLERADDPARDPIGTVREELDRSATYVRTAQGWMTVHDPRHTGIEMFAYDDLMSRAPIIGVVPGTPAADAQTPPEVVRSGDPEPPRDARYTDTGGDTWSYGVHGDGSTGWGFGKAPWTWTWDDHPLRFPWTLKEGA